MAEAIGPAANTPGMGSGKDGALDAALERLAPGRLSSSQTEPWRGDTPDFPITAVRRLPAVPAAYVDFPAALDARLQRVLEARGIRQLYSHQAEAIDHALSGRHIVVTTPTASGKTLCYNAPVLHRILQDPASRALYLFPTKALAQDQLVELHAMSEAIRSESADQVGVFTYDGDTPQDARRAIRARAHIVLSNPDMVHSGILPHHPRWAKLFENLRYVVIDELHAYRGVFGAHLCNVLRRLHRICRHYGSSPVFLCSSATIANPRELAERLTGQKVEVVERSGAPRGEKLFVFVNPPVVNHQLGIRRSYLAETRRVALEFIRRNLQVIVFAQSRLATEILTTYLKDDYKDLARGRLAAPSGGDASSAVRGYRGGYLPNRRREIEKGLREGSVRAVVSTNALELGIDIGALDVSVMAGYPGTIAATWQRAGRAGRRSGRSAAVLVASSAPLDQFIIRSPAYFFDRSPEHALIDPDNLHILVDHIKCAAFELPFTSTERFGRHDLQEILGVLAEQGLVHLNVRDDTGRAPHPSPERESLRSSARDSEAATGRGEPAPHPSPERESLRSSARDSEAGWASGGGAPREVDKWTWTSESYPADAVSLRSMSSDNFVVVDTTDETTVIGETDFTSGPATLHPQAIYLVEGRLYQVERLDFAGRKAFVRQVDCDYYTDAITYTRVTVIDTFAGSASPADGETAGRPEIPAAGGHSAAPRAYGSACGPREALEGSEAEPSRRARASGGGAPRAYGEVQVVSRVIGFKKIRFYTNENVGSGDLDLPEQQMHTTSYWLTVPAAIMAMLPCAADDRRDGIVGLAVALRQVAQLLLMCDRHDIGISIDTDADASPEAAVLAPSHRGAPAPPQPCASPRIFVYDNYPSGIGFSEPLFRMHDELLSETRRLIAACECEHGCPGCVGPVGETGPLAKTVALRILDLLLAEPVAA